jgi:hypothetical protein
MRLLAFDSEPDGEVGLRQATTESRRGVSLRQPRRRHVCAGRTAGRGRARASRAGVAEVASHHGFSRPSQARAPSVHRWRPGGQPRPPVACDVARARAPRARLTLKTATSPARYRRSATSKASPGQSFVDPKCLERFARPAPAKATATSRTTCRSDASAIAVSRATPPPARRRCERHGAPQFEPD